MFDLEDLLRRAGIDPATVIVMRHTPTEPDLRRALPILASERHEVFNAYQCSHGEMAEGSLGRASYLVSFIGHEAGRAIFVGVYEVVSWRDVTSEEFWALPHNDELRALGTRGPANDRTSRWFNLRLTESLADWKGRLVIGWPPGRLSWRKGAAKMPVVAIHDEPKLAPKPPRWNELVITWQELQTMPRSWQDALRQWRGVYVIVDRQSGQSYVGSAFGSDNLLGRWSSYAKSGHGHNVDLKGRDPTHFRFAILQLVAQDMAKEEVERLEASWKDRLATREFGLNKN